MNSRQKRLQKISCTLLVTLFVSGLQERASVAQEPSKVAKISSVPDALGLDVSSEGILARSDVRDAGVSLSSASAEGLKLMISKSDVGLVPGPDFSLEDRFAARAFVHGGWVAAKRLINEGAKTKAMSGASATAQTLKDREPPSLLGLASGGALIDEMIQTVDGLLERKWTARAREILYAIEPSLYVVIDEPAGGLLISWMEAHARTCLEVKQADQQTKMLLDLVRKRTLPPDANLRRDWLAQLWMRLLYCSFLDQDQPRFEVESGIVTSLFGEVVFVPKASGSDELANGTTNETIGKAIEKWRAELESRTKANEAQRLKLKTVPLSEYSTKVYEYQFDEQRYAPPKVLYPGYPPNPLVIHSKTNGDMVFGRKSFQLFGWRAGQAWHWPDVKQVEQLNLNPNWSGPDLNLADEMSLGGFANYKDELFALVDSRERSSASSDILRDALLVGLKLPEGVQSVDNTPMSARRVLVNVLTTQSKEKATFKGTPLIVGDRLFVMVVDDARGRAYRIACFQLPSLELSWLSSSIGIEGSVVGGLSNVCMLYHQGRLFIASGRGSIAALQAEDGKPIFQVNYSPKIESPYDGGLKVHVRSALVVAGETIVCGPSDANSIFAIDYTDGHVHWAMESDQAQRALQIAGVLGEYLICLGDRIGWINPNTGLPERIVELSRSTIPMGGQVELREESVMWTNGDSIYRYPLRASEQTQKYSRVEIDDLERWPYASREPLAFGISESHLSVITASSWIIFEAK